MTKVETKLTVFSFLGVNHCCPSPLRMAYKYNADTGKNLMILGPRSAIIVECSDRCACFPNCSNRVVQSGRSIDLELFRAGGKGWGLKTKQNLDAGEFVMEFIGKVGVCSLLIPF